MRCLLLVDDNTDCVEEVTRQIVDSQLDVTELVVAHSLGEALRLIKTTCPDVILLDLDLGDSKALATLEAVRDQTDAVVIVLNDNADESLGVEALKAGADDFLVKSEVCEACLRASIVNSTVRRNLRLTSKRMKSNLNSLCEMAGV